MTKTASEKRTRRKRAARPQPAEFLPVHQAKAFESDLDGLISSLAQREGWKGGYLLSEYKAKYLDPELVPPAERERAAIRKWLASERRNRKTNQRLQLGLTNWRSEDPRDWAGDDLGWTNADAIVSTARRFIAGVLGPLDYPRVLYRGGHTNGATVGQRKQPDASILKCTGLAHVSSPSVKHWHAFLEGGNPNLGLHDQALCGSENSVMFTVPKATEIDRAACKEPSLNMFLQRSIGQHIRRRLRRRGIDLNDQTINQRLACEALNRGLATIDLSSASDSITKQLVYCLLPFEWWSLLSDLRVERTKIKGVDVELEMFSSMGNGFTFELESLIFWALAHAIKYLSKVRGTVSVYGDDIIVPVAIAPRLARTFAWFGFKVNTKKSHWAGWFRESCGKHYYRGIDVTPFYVREPVKSKLHVIRLLNRLLEWQGRGWGFIHDEATLAFHKKWSQIIPQELWGGADPEDQSALVTGHSPRSRFVLAQKPLRFVKREMRTRKRLLARWKAQGIKNPESKLRPLRELSDEEARYERGAYILWHLTKAGSDGSQEPFEVDPCKAGDWKITRQPAWTVRTTWRPWVLDP